MKAMKGARALIAGALFLAAAYAVPAVSAAQEGASPPEPAPTTTTLDQALQDNPPTGNDAAGAGTQAAPAGAAAGTPGEPRDGSGTASPPIGDSPPAAAPGGGAHASASASVTMADFFFSPGSVTVAVGDTVTWHNSGQAPHTATADNGSFDTGTVNAGGSASHRFTTAGTFTYTCTIHPNMHGTVRVLSASGGGSSKGGSGGSAGSTSNSGSNLTEEQAVTSPDAAGNSTTLPMTGMAAGALALVGAGLLALGLIARLARL
jgi:plastocyanin